MKFLKFLVGFTLGLMLLVLPLSQFQPEPLAPLQSLAVQIDGRKKPLDTVALETVQKLHGSASYKQTDGSKLDYLQTYFALAFNDRDWNNEPFLLFSYRPLKEEVGLNPEQKYFSFQELLSSKSLSTVINRAHAREIAGEDLVRLEREALSIEDRATLLYRTVGDNSLPLVPHPSDLKGTWVTIDKATDLYSPETAADLMALEQQVQQGYRFGGAAHMDYVGQLGGKLKQALAELSPMVYPSDATLNREVFYNHFHPFGKAWMMFGLGFLVMLVSLWFKPLELYGSAIGLAAAGLTTEAYGFILRMQIADRPPVTNMYESVIWVSFGVIALALIFELTSDKARYYLLSASPVAVVCLLLADRLPVVLDPSIAPLVPVLRDNFWLSIHVPTITLGYAAFALAMGLGHVSLGHYLFANPANPTVKKRLQTLSQFNYRTLQVGVLLLTTGVILGGIWAHFSWGRFWGWDPKETWALIALLCYLVPLHGRLVGWIGNFGINVAAVVSFNAVLMAWYGVNFVLGTGLHSYGFGTGDSQLIVAAVVVADLAIVALTAVRHRSRKPAAKPLIVEDVTLSEEAIAALASEAQ